MLLDATAKMMDGRKITDVKLPFLARHALKFALKKSDATVIGDLLKRYQLI
jgi:oleate hydratase